MTLTFCQSGPRALARAAEVRDPAQFGEPWPGKPSYGRSLIADPWGVVLAEAPDEDCVILAEIDRGRMEEIRRRLPSLANRQPAAYRSPTGV